ncbi:MAG: tryptophan-rich sensory protein [Alistipes sp.]|nr:tryptophan-rich sensory protein [Alistipes sp.]
MKKTLAFVVPIVLALTIGVFGSYMQTSALEHWYPTLVKSPLTPPAIVFPIAWTVLYVLMGISLGVMVAKGDMSLVRIWLLQLLVNFLWSIGFFTLRSPLMGLIIILVLDVLVFAYILYAIGHNRLAAWIFVPYMLWLLFATYLTGYIYLNNDTVGYRTINAANITNTNINMSTATQLSAPALHYAADALAPTMSRETIDYHYSRHLKGYFDNLNRLIAGTPYENMNLEQIVMHSNGAIFNNAAQALNHILFFDNLTPSQGQMPKRLQQAIIRDFGSVENFKEQFTAAATSLFGSGWVWLVEDKSGKLSIVSTSNADTPLRQGLNPLLVLDVWEHAYYIDHRNRRADFINGWWNIANWQTAEERLQQ